LLGTGGDLLDDRRLRVGVRVYVGPIPAGKLSLGSDVAASVGRVDAQPVPEQKMTPFLFPARGTHMDMDVEARGAQHPVAAFPNPQLIAGTFKRWQVGGLVVGVIDAKVDVDNWLGCEPRNRGRANVVDAPATRPQRTADPDSLVFEPVGPGRIV
jgi:hypothetical protein